jgi:uncharacterized membrane protein (DUF485 family)
VADHPADVDWQAIEQRDDFQELVRGRRRFAWTAGTIGIGLGVVYVVLAGLAPDLMGTKVFGSMSLGFVGGVALIFVTWAITFAYMRRSNQVWGPLEARIREAAEPRTRDEEPERVEEPQEVSR